jgi:hypothetical protein
MDFPRAIQHDAPDLVSRVHELQASLRQAASRGLTPEEQAAITALADAIRILLDQPHTLKRRSPKPLLPPNLVTEAQLNGTACICCGAEDQPMRLVETWSRLSTQLFECVDVEACTTRQPHGPST